MNILTSIWAPRLSIAQKVKAIHREFNTAAELLLEEAKKIINDPGDEKAKRLDRLGFHSSKEVKEYTTRIIANNKLKEAANKIEYFQVYYPNNKFITEDQVKKICEKYGLIKCSIRKYIGTVPVKNLTQIEAFKLRKEDYSLEGWSGSAQGYPVRMADGTHVWRTNPSHAEMFQALLEICAPKKDFDTTGMEVKEGYKLQLIPVPDPVVLQPVRGGYLIVTAWGDEASDEDVVNQAQN